MTEQTQWKEGKISGTQVRTLGNGVTVVTLGHSDANYPPGTPEPRLNVNTTALWMKVEIEDYKSAGYPFPLGWWCILTTDRSMHKAKKRIDSYGYTLPPEMKADYWFARLVELEQEKAESERLAKRWANDIIDEDTLRAIYRSTVDRAKLSEVFGD